MTVTRLDPGAAVDKQAAASAEPATDAAGLEAVCRMLAEVVRSVPGPVRRVRVGSGATSVEVEWSDAPAPAAAPVDLPPVVVETPSTEDVHVVKAPMVGTFYHAPEPGAKVFVSPGDVVSKGQPIGLVEAMKLMNLIEADVAGRVTEVLVPNGAPVEFDQPLVALAPLDREEHPKSASGGGT